MTYDYKTFKLPCLKTDPRAQRAAAAFPKRLHDKHKGKIILRDTAVYDGNIAHIDVKCTVCSHEWSTQPSHLVNTGAGCPSCAVKAAAQRKLEITLSKVGKTTAEGHLILEHIGYRQSPYDLKHGHNGKAMFRYKCAQCGNDEATALGNDLFTDGHTTHCGCQQVNRETINHHLRNKQKALQPCQFYIASFYFDTYLKLGISKMYETRAALGNQGNPYFEKDLTPEQHYKEGNLDLSYEHTWFLSPEYPRSWVFSVEQILLAATKHYAPKEALPKEVIETCWAGQTELRDFMLSPKQVEAAFFRLIRMIQQADGDWYQVYKQQINKFQIQ